MNRQGPDTGSQYRTVIFAHSEDQSLAAHQSKTALEQSKRFAKAISTTIEEVGDFWLAEDYHQQFFDKRGISSSAH